MARRSLFSNNALAEKPPPKQWRELLKVPAWDWNDTIAIYFQGEQWTKDDYETLRHWVEYMGRLFPNDRYSENTDDEFGWWKEERR